MKRNIVIEMNVNIDYGRKLIRSCCNPPEIEMLDACTPLHLNSEKWFDVFRGQTAEQQQLIKASRLRLAERIAADLTSHLLDQWLAADDTLDGYKKGER